MNNPYYYLFYRFNQFWNKKGTNEFGPIAAVTFFTGQYLLIIYGEILDVNEATLSQHKFIMIGILIALYVLNTITFTNKKRLKMIDEVFHGESLNKRRFRGFLVVLFMIAPLIWFLF